MVAVKLTGTTVAAQPTGGKHIKVRALSSILLILYYRIMVYTDSGTP